MDGRYSSQEIFEKIMVDPTDNEIESLLVALISDGFNRALNALESAGAVDTRIIRSQYAGIGTKYYDIVADQVVVTAAYGAVQVRKLFSAQNVRNPQAKNS